MIEKVINYIEKNNLINKNDKILVAFSGGSDSLCLLKILELLKDRYNIEIGACHVNHNIRGEFAKADEVFCENYCNEHNIPIYVLDVDVTKEAKLQKKSVEEVSRKIRYDFFKSILEKEGYTKIAIAHNKNDQAETLIFRILRGTGIKGLTGILAKRDDIYIRPLLNTSRLEIEKFLEDNNLKGRQDHTNFESIYTRNKIRLEVLPYIEENFNKEIISTLNRLSQNVKEDDDYLETVASYEFKNHLILKEDNKVVLKKSVASLHKAILSRVIFKAIEQLKKNRMNIESKHIDDAIDLLKLGTGKKIELQDNIDIYNNYGNLEFTYRNIRSKCEKNKKLTYTNEEENQINHKSNEKNESNKNNGSNGIRVNIFDLKEEKEFTLNGFMIKLKVTDKEKSKDKIKVDALKLGSFITLRNRLEKDKIKPLGMSSYKKIKNLFIDRKVHRDLRDKIPFIVSENNEIAYIYESIIGEDFKITKESLKVLEIEVEKID